MTRELCPLKRWGATVALLLMAYWSGLAGFWTAQRDPPIQYEALALIDYEVEQGAHVRAVHTVMRRAVCKLTVERSIVDGAGILFRLEDQVFHAGRSVVGQLEAFTQLTPVPAAAAPGKARLRETLTHVCNPIHQMWPVVQRLPDLEFVILAADRQG